jgi:aspartyl-tRNA(Asn)/glutamyl-tRNA(Gln) amidotransferase subunit A
MAAADPHDPATLNSPRGDLESALSGAPDVRGMRISALAPEAFPAFTSPDVVRVYREAIDVLRDLGARVDEGPFALDFDEMVAQNGRITAAEAYAVHRAYLEDPKLDIDPWVKKRTLGGKGISAADYIDMLEQRRRTIAEFKRWMRDRDAALTPTVPITATPLAQVDEATSPLTTWTRSANYVGGCAISLPAGFSADHLPIGVQLIGTAFADGTLVRLGRAFQNATDWHLRRPGQAGRNPSIDR